MDNVNSTGATLIVWVVCGVFAMLAALSYCELGSMYPNSSGGEYYYIMQVPAIIIIIIVISIASSMKFIFTNVTETCY